MALIRPRLNDYYGIPLTQAEVDFAIPFLDEDIPLYLDPFLLWKSPSLQDNALHTAIVNSFNHLGHSYLEGHDTKAVERLVRLSECDEAGLGMSRRRRGHRISEDTAYSILRLFEDVPQIRNNGFTHVEAIQLLVDNISKDRVSDIACNLIKSFLIDFTIEQCQKYGLPMSEVMLPEVYDYRRHQLEGERIGLPINPADKRPILLIPKRWLRSIPWISYDDYLNNFFPKEVEDADGLERVALLNYNRHNYGVVEHYLKQKERTFSDCRNDPLFSPIPVFSAKRKLSYILSLPSGKKENADRKYEDNICQLMSSLVYPHLDFAAEQNRTDSGVLIRDLIFYNNRSTDFLADIYSEYGCRQIVMELKNVRRVQREHVNQLNRYMNDQFGRFGILITRNRLPKNIYRNTIDLWAGQRKCIIVLTDEDISLMVSVFESKQRLPIEVLKKKYIQFIRDCPS